jgi:hypothetical protein
MRAIVQAEPPALLQAQETIQQKRELKRPMGG